MAATYIWPNLRTLLLEGFTEDELRQFCFDIPDFKPLYPQLARYSSQADIVQQVLEYAERTSKIEFLLAWAKERNPAQYERHQPYRSRCIEPADTAEALALAETSEITQRSPAIIAPKISDKGKAEEPVPSVEPAHSPALLTFDVFISYSPADRAWIQGELLPRLEREGLRICIDFRNFRPGAPRPTEVERAVLTSHKTLLILSPAYLEDEWAEFGDLMVQTLDPASRQRRLIPLLKAKCDLPLRLSHLWPVDLVDPVDRDTAWVQLLTALSTH